MYVQHFAGQMFKLIAVVTCLIARWEDPGSNVIMGSCVFHDSHCHIWALAAQCTP